MDQSDHSKGMTMSTVFNTNTEITLFFHSWTTTTAASYTFTLIFLFVLAVVNRFLSVLKFQLDLKHTEPTETGVPKLQLPTAPRRRHAVPKDRESPLPRYVAVAENDPDQEAAFPSAPFLGPDHERAGDELTSISTLEPAPLAQRGWWTACRRWSWRRDGTSSLLEGLRALVGYAL
jgi:hypothetical protein